MMSVKLQRANQAIHDKETVAREILRESSGILFWQDCSRDYSTTVNLSSNTVRVLLYPISH